MQNAQQQQQEFPAQLASIFGNVSALPMQQHGYPWWRRRRMIKLAGLEARRATLAQIVKSMTEGGSYYIDMLLDLDQRIAEMRKYLELHP